MSDENLGHNLNIAGIIDLVNLHNNKSVEISNCPYEASCIHLDYLAPNDMYK